jgi:hypothetical protein
MVWQGSVALCWACSGEGESMSHAISFAIPQYGSSTSALDPWPDINKNSTDKPLQIL